MAGLSMLSDIELMRLLKQKDEPAFTEIYRRHWHMLYLHTYKILMDSDESKDLVQDLFISFWTKAEELDVQTNVKGYLYKAARNRVLNLIRNKKVNHDFIDLISELMDEADNATLEGINERELIRLIDEEIRLLPKKMKEVFELSRKSFLSNKAIAAELGMSEEAVKKQITRSIKVLKGKIGSSAGLFWCLIL